MRTAGFIAALDSLAAVLALTGVLIGLNLPAVQRGVDEFLSARITVKNVLLLILLASAWPAIFYMFGLYDARRVRHFRSELTRLIGAVSVGSALASAFPLTSVTGTVTLSDIPHFWAAALGLCLLVRLLRRTAERARLCTSRTLIVGSGPLAQRALSELSLDPERRWDVVGFVDEPSAGRLTAERFDTPLVGTLEDLEHILMHQVIDEVIIALPVKSQYEQIQLVINLCERAGVQAKYAADIFASSVASPKYDAHGERTFVAMQVAPEGGLLVVKRAIDIAGAAAGLVLLAPLMVMIAIAIKVTSAGGITFAQDRCGLHKRPFRMYKFRSMYADAEARQAALEELNEASGPVFKIRNDPRITPVGRLLRRSSLDELPQLWNVLRGDMSLVGPRPLPWRDVRRVGRPSDMRRFSVRPGLTCLWQVQGRNNLDFDQWVALDLEYIDRWSLTLDLRILAKTIPAVLSGNGAA